MQANSAPSQSVSVHWLALVLAPACAAERMDNPPGDAASERSHECVFGSDLTLSDPTCPASEGPPTVSLIGTGAATVPVVGQLSDDNGDGAIDALDRADVAVIEWGGGSMWTNAPADLVVMDIDGTEWVRAGGFRMDATPAIGDVNGDGFPDVVGITVDNRIRAVDHLGAVLWTSEAFPMLWPSITLADLTGDGTAEVIGDVGVVHGDDGTTIATLAQGAQYPWRTPATVDVDFDGTQEILLGDRLYSHLGVQQWRQAGNALTGFNAVVQLDSDDAPEFATVRGSELHFVEHTGEFLRKVSLPDAYGGPPCAADLDFDGLMEVVVPSLGHITAFHGDLTIFWQRATNDPSGSAGCSIADLDADGSAEILYADETDFYVLNGATGATRFVDPAHTSITQFEYPVVVDVDGDHQLEVLVSRTEGGVAVYRAPQWRAAAGSSWSTQDFRELNVSDDGQVVAFPEPSWVAGIGQAERVTTVSDPPPSVDFQVEWQSTCQHKCVARKRFELQFRIANTGSSAGTATVEFRGTANDGSVTVFRQETLNIDANATSEDFAWSIPSAELKKHRDFELAVRSAGAAECDESNNAVSVRLPCLEQRRRGGARW